MLVDGAVTDIVLMGTGSTEICSDASLDSIFAEIVAVTGVPPSTLPAETRPELDTLAALVSDDCQEAVRPARMLPSLSRAIAVNCTEEPLETAVADGSGATIVTVETGEFGSVGEAQARRNIASTTVLDVNVRVIPYCDA